MASAAPPADAATKKKEETTRRDRLQQIEAEKQQAWANAKLYEFDAPKEGEAHQEKFMATFPYPYMNGRLHLGHAFSLSKPEIRTRFEIMQGKRGMFPMGFHVTGMPIAAAANRLKREIQEFGNPPVFPKVEAPAEPAAGTASAGGNFKGRQLKKAPANKRQWEIMESMKVPDIADFQESLKWLEYFPPLAVDDLRRFGAAVDWRRSFITTEENPFYDSFIKWQFRHLASQGRLAFGKRLAVFSPLDGQPCADHDRSEGEGAVPQEYTLVKLPIIEPENWPAFAAHLDKIKGKTISLCAATLRPETMFGQTNCWILPEGEYGVYPLNETELVIMAQRAANNMAWQHIGTQHDCEPKPEFTVTGQELIGAPLKAPLAKYDKVHLLPMASVKMNKGTGIVTSVPADSPDDFVNWRQLREKPEYRAKLGIKDEWILPFELVSVTNIPGIGEFPAKVLCEQKNVDGPKHVALAECHDTAYLKSWEDGFLAVDDEKFRGHKVKVARNEVKQHLIDLGQGIAYSEPDKKVVSRSGDECVVALCDQYYLKYGTDKEWQAQIRDYVNNGLNCYSEGVKKGFREVVEWFGEWPCSRNFGLGTTIPVPGGEKYLIDSLSDSTIYWAYYTLCPFLQGGAAYNGTYTSDDGSHLNLDSKKPSPAGIKPEEMTDDVWDALLLGKPEIDDLQTTIDKNVLKTMRREFLYWYPIDMRGSGKDLIQNHLTMALYNHQAIFGAQMMPKSYYCNGHILVDGEKMAKSKGNFLTLKEAMDAYGTDATRIAMAEAGDSLDDANFVRDVANSLVLKLTKELDWAEEVAKFKGDLRTGEFKFFDRAFENAINKSVAQSERYYVNMQFREALRVAFHDLQKARDVYRQQVGGDKGMHQELINRWLEVQALTMAPIAPHWSEYLWQNILGNTTNVVTQRYPQATKEVNAILELSVDYLDSVIVELRKILAKAPKKGDEKVNSGNVFVVTSYEPWQVQTIEWLKTEFAANNNSLPADVAKRVPDALKKNLKEVMPFVGFLKEQVAKYGADKTFGDAPVLPELSILNEQNDYIKQQLGIQNLNVYAANDASAPDAAVRARARLQKPTAVFSHQA